MSPGVTFTSTAATSSGRETIILATGVTWRRLAIEGFDRLIGKGIYYGASRSEASATHGLDIYLIGGGNSAGQAALYFANHARSVTLILRGDSLQKSMSRYLVEQLRGKSNVAVQLRSEVVGAHGDTHLTAIDIRDGASAEVRRHDCGGLFVFIGADAETDWLPPEIARDARGYVLTGDDVVKAGRWSHQPRSLPARIECAWRVRLWGREVEPGQARRVGGRRGQHGDRVRPQISAARRQVVRVIAGGVIGRSREGSIIGRIELNSSEPRHT